MHHIKKVVIRIYPINEWKIWPRRAICFMKIITHNKNTICIFCNSTNIVWTRTKKTISKKCLVKSKIIFMCRIGKISRKFTYSRNNIGKRKSIIFQIQNNPIKAIRFSNVYCLLNNFPAEIFISEDFFI